MLILEIASGVVLGWLAICALKWFADFVKRHYETDRPVGFETTGAELAFPDDVKNIELWACGYDAHCKVPNCGAMATMIARSMDSDGRPIHQYELCQTHADQFAERERGKGRQIINREVNGPMRSQ
jgi:hypothetical protein